MVHTIYPFGAINESLVVKVYENSNGFFILDSAGNRSKIDADVYNKLKKEGF